MDDSLKPFVTAVDHVGVAVPDLDAAIDFYVDTFGLKVTHTEVNEEQGVREAMLHAQGDEGTGTAIQLLAPLRPDSAIGKFLDKSGAVVSSETTTVGPVAPKKSGTFKITTAKGGVYGYRYKPIS